MSPEALAEKILERLKGGPLHFEDICCSSGKSPTAWCSRPGAGCGKQVPSGASSKPDATPRPTVRIGFDPDVMPDDPDVLPG